MVPRPSSRTPFVSELVPLVFLVIRLERDEYMDDNESITAHDFEIFRQLQSSLTCSYRV